MRLLLHYLRDSLGRNGAELISSSLDQPTCHMVLDHHHLEEKIVDVFSDQHAFRCVCIVCRHVYLSNSESLSRPDCDVTDCVKLVSDSG